MPLQLNLKQLKVFYYVAKNLSFARAAEELFVTQPAVRMQIDALEDQYETKFFSRHGKKLALTDAGEILYSYAERIIELALEGEQTILNLKAHPQGVVRIGTTKTWARYLMPTYILRFQRQYPDIRIQLDEGSSEEMATSVLHGVNDLAIVGRVPYDERLETLSFPGHEADELVLVVYPGHRLSRRKSVSLEDMQGEPLILKEKGSGTRQVTSTYFEQNGFSPKILLEAGSSPFIKDLIKKEAGASILTKLSIEEEARKGSLKGLSFKDGGLWLNIDIVLLKEGYRSSAARSFLDFLITVEKEEAAYAPPPK